MSNVLDSSVATGPDQPKHLDTRSIQLFKKAQKFFPDGTSRATIDSTPYPRYINRGEGAYVTDIDGNRFLDLNNNFTTLIHGHGFPPVVEAIRTQLRDGSCFANPTESEIKLASLICSRVPHLEQIRFVNSGTEAVMFSIKAARAFTKKASIAKVEGAYHGAYDWVEVSQFTHPGIWGDPDRPVSTPFYEGVPQTVLDEVVVLRFNDVEGARSRLAKNADKIACMVLDPMPSRAGLITPDTAFIDAIQETCRENNILIIADEVLNFRQSYEGASAKYGLTPDLFALGKIIGGGFPIGAIGGRRDVMHMFNARVRRPPVPQGGTFSANPLSMTAGLAAMEALDRVTFDHLDRLGQNVRDELSEIAQQCNAPFCVTGAGSLFRIHPTYKPPRDFRDAFMHQEQLGVAIDLKRHFQAHGILMPIDASASLSTPMTSADTDKITGAFKDFLSLQY